MKLRLPCLLLPLAALLAACTKSEPEPAGGDAGAQSVAPLDGKSLGKSKQLEGRWVRVGEAEFDSLEFLPDGKAIVGGADAGLSVEYAVLEGGRLALTAPGGITSNYGAKIAGSEIELTSSGNVLSEAGTFRYRRLAKGETVRDVLAAAAEAKREAYRKRVAALEALLRQPGLVLAFAGEGAGAPASIALDVEVEGGMFAGRAWHDDRPPHLNSISGQVYADEMNETASIQVTYGPRIAPPATRPDGGGQIMMQATGGEKDLRVAANVTFGGSGPSHELVLRSDPKRHAEIVARYEAELARLEALKRPLAALLAEHAVLLGRVQPVDARRTDWDALDLTLARDAESGQYWAEGVFVGARGRGEWIGNAAAEIVVSNDQPLLRIVTPPSREYLLSMRGADSRTLSGRWSGSGASQASSAELEVVEALDAGARDALFGASRRALLALGSDAEFSGLAFEDSASGMEMPVAFRMRLGVAPDGGVTGKAEYPTLATVMDVTGRVVDSRVGPRLELRYSGVERTPGDKIFHRSIQNGTWRLAPSGDASRLAGSFDGPPLRATTLSRVDAASSARLREKLASTLRPGARFHVAKFVGWQTPNVAATVVELELDPAGERVTGKMVADGAALGTNDRLSTRYEGEVADDGGRPVLRVMQVSTHRNTRAYTALELHPCEDEQGVLHLNGRQRQLGNTTLDQPAPPFPSEFDRILELVPVDAADAATRAVIDGAVAAAEKKRADAAAAEEAAAAAALEAKRAKLAPFLPLLGAAPGAAITTDAPARMGKVLTEVSVDEAAAKVSGKGIDLRDSPARDFTFECDVDNRGNLTVTTSLAPAPLAFAPPADGKSAKGRGVTLTVLSEAERAELDALIATHRRLEGSAQAVLSVEVIDAAAAKAREAAWNARAMPGIALYRNAKNDKVALMFDPASNGRYRWQNEPVTHRLDAPMKGSALYIKNGGPTNDLVVVLNGVHRASVPAIEALGAAIITLPPDLEILDIRLQADGIAQARGVALLP